MSLRITHRRLPEQWAISQRRPQPADPDLLVICHALTETPDDASTLGAWASTPKPFSAGSAAKPA
jgi:hypothetical protein